MSDASPNNRKKLRPPHERSIVLKDDENDRLIQYIIKHNGVVSIFSRITLFF